MCPFSVWSTEWWKYLHSCLHFVVRGRWQLKCLSWMFTFAFVLCTGSTWNPHWCFSKSGCKTSQFLPQGEDLFHRKSQQCSKALFVWRACWFHSVCACVPSRDWSHEPFVRFPFFHCDSSLGFGLRHRWRLPIAKGLKARLFGLFTSPWNATQLHYTAFYSRLRQNTSLKYSTKYLMKGSMWKIGHALKCGYA